MRVLLQKVLLGCCLHLAASATLADPLDTTADAVLGQPDLVTNVPNYPSGLPTDSNLAPSNAAHVAVAPDGRIYVSDADNNRVLSWPAADAFTDGQAADMVIGQPDFVSDAPNNGGVSASSFFLPQGLAVDAEGNLWVADAFNSRVLKFIHPADTDTAADLVIGQPDFISNDQNLGNGEHGTDVALPDGLQFPGRVLVRGQDVYVADSGNSRVLHYTNPVTNKPPADLVFGQFGNFFTRAKNNDGQGNNSSTPSADNLLNPIGIALDRRGRFYVADWGNHRVLRFDDPLNTDTTADAVFGQPDFVSNAIDNGGLTAGMQLPIDVSVEFGAYVYIADSGNNRVLVYDNPLANTTAAAAVFGQLGNLATDDINHGLGVFETDADGLFGPTGLAHDGLHNLYVVDVNNSRTLRFDLPIPLPIPGDINHDGHVDLADFVTFAGCFGMMVASPSPSCSLAEVEASDLDGDGEVNLSDFVTFAGNFGS